MFAAIAMDGASVLPAAEETIFVFDEAHSLGAKAVEHFSARHALLGTVEWLERAVNAVRDAVLGLRLDAGLLRGGVESSGRIEQALRELHRRIDATGGFDDKRARRFRGGVLPPWCRSAGEQILTSRGALQKTFASLREHVLEQAASCSTRTAAARARAARESPWAS